MSNKIENAEKKHRRMHSIITMVQQTPEDVCCRDEQFEMLEILRELLPTQEEILKYVASKNPLSSKLQES